MDSTKIDGMGPFKVGLHRQAILGLKCQQMGHRSNKGLPGSLHYAFNIHTWVKLELYREAKFSLEYSQKDHYVKIGYIGSYYYACNMHRLVKGQTRTAQGSHIKPQMSTGGL